MTQLSRWLLHKYHEGSSPKIWLNIMLDASLAQALSVLAANIQPERAKLKHTKRDV
jgi:hypothetical protein